MEQNSQKKGRYSGLITSANKRYNVKLSVISFEEDGSFVIYCPALDFSGYGETFEAAEKSPLTNTFLCCIFVQIKDLLKNNRHVNDTCNYSSLRLVPEIRRRIRYMVE